MKHQDLIDILSQRLQQPLPGIAAQNKMASRARTLPIDVPDDAKKSAVLSLLFPKEEQLNLLLIKRAEDGRPHSGQIAFPGGRYEEQDKDLLETALRETEEEVGIAPDNIQVLGALSNLYIPVSNSNVQPYVGFTTEPPVCIINKDEVQYTIEVPLNELFLPNRKTTKHITPSAFPDITIKAPAYDWDDDHLIWGATAMMIAELEEVLKLY